MLSFCGDGSIGLPSSSCVGPVSVAVWIGLPLPLACLILRPFLPGGVGSFEEPSPPFDGSGSWTVRVCLASASDLVNALSHSTFPH